MGGDHEMMDGQSKDNGNNHDNCQYNKIYPDKAVSGSKQFIAVHGQADVGVPRLVIVGNANACFIVYPVLEEGLRNP